MSRMEYALEGMIVSADDFASECHDAVDGTPRRYMQSLSSSLSARACASWSSCAGIKSRYQQSHGSILRTAAKEGTVAMLHHYRSNEASASCHRPCAERRNLNFKRVMSFVRA